jgi:PAS domain S-box-containing protein
MDVTTTAPQTHNWELLAQLALCGQDITAPLETAAFVQQLVSLLQSHLPHPWGLLVETSQGGQARAYASWGLSSDEAQRLTQSNGIPEKLQGWYYPIRAGNEELGHLLLSPLKDQQEQQSQHDQHDQASADQTYYQAIAAQLGLLLQTQRRGASSVPELAADNPQVVELNLINCINRIISANSSPYAVLEQAYDCLAAFLPAESGNVALYQADTAELTWLLQVTADQRSIAGDALKLEAHSPLAQVIQGQQPRIGSGPASPAWMGTPLLTHDEQVIGAILLHSSTPDVYGSTELQHLTAAAAHLALAIQNARLLAQAEEQVLQLGLLYNVSTVAASAHEMTSVYKVVINAMVQVTGVDQARLVLCDRETSTGYIVAEHIPTDLPQHETIDLEENATFAWLEQHKTPLIAHDAQNDPLFAQSHDTFRELDIRSIALVPLILGGEVVGSIGLDFVGRQVHFSRQQVDFCQTIANHVATVIDKDRFFTQAQASSHALRTKVGELSTLLESSGILGSLLQPDEVLSSLIDLVSRQLRVSSVALWTLHSDNLLIPTALYGLESEHIEEMRLPVGQGMTGAVAATGLPLIVHDIDEYGGSTYDPHFFGQDNRLTSFMGVPIFYRDRVVGVLSVMTGERREFSSDEMMVLVGLASQAAIAMENARLFQERDRRIKELTTINQISVAVNGTLELDDLLLALHRNISTVLDTRYSLIGMYEETRLDAIESALVLRVIRNDDETHLSDQTAIIDGKGLLDYVVLTSSPLLLQTVDDIRSHVSKWHTHHDPEALSIEQLSALHVPFACWLGVPIMVGHDVLGIINLQSREPFAYNSDDLRFLSTVASQVAVAIANARLFAERERRLRELSVLKDIGSAISSTMEPQMVLENLRHELTQALDVSTAMIGLYDEISSVITYNVCYDQGRRVHITPSRILPESNSANSWVIRNRQPLLLHNVEQARQIGFSDFGFSMFDLRSAQSLQRLPQSRYVQSCLAVPIISGDSVLGVINIQSYQEYAFDQDDLRFVMTVANQTAVTIANIYLFIERGRRIEELATFNEIGRALSATVSVEELPELVYRQTSRLLNTTNFYVALLDEERGEVTFPLFYDNGMACTIAQTADRPPHPSYIGAYRFPPSPENIRYWPLVARLTERVINLGEPLIVHGADVERSGWVMDLQELRDEVHLEHINTPHQWMGVPMIASDKVLGVIAVQDYEHENVYGPDEVRVLSTIASAAAIAMQNARLFEQISNLAADLEARVDERTTELAEANMQLLEEKERLEVVHAITLELSATLDLEVIICRALEMASINMGVERGSIMLLDTQDRQLVCRAVLRDQGIADSVQVPIHFEGGLGLSHWVLKHQESVCIDDVRSDSRWIVEEGRADEARSVVAVPLMTGDTTLGVLILSSPYTDYFTESQLRLLATIANEVAITINNAQLYSYITEMATRLADLLEQQKEETSKSRSVFLSMTEGVMVLDVQHNIVVLNPAAEHMLGILGEHVLEQPLACLAHQGETDDEQKRAQTIYNELDKGLQIANERQGIYNTSFELTNPTQVIAVNLSPVVAPDQRSYGNVAVLRDVTREIEADRSQREFFSKASHELRTPLTSLKGYIDMLKLGLAGNLSKEHAEWLSIAQNNANRLRALTEDILDISRFDANRMELSLEQIDIHKAINGVLQDLRLEADKKAMTIKLELADDLPRLEADAKRLTQVLTNLLSNAIKYTYEEGYITIRAFLNPANLLQVEIEDTGVGMSLEDQQKLFRPFYRTNNPMRDKVSGTGLGLSIAKSLVERHGGEMWVTSEPGKGSIFSFVLPLEQPRDANEANEDNQ